MEAVIFWEERGRGNHEHAVRLSKFTLDLEPRLDSYHACGESDNGIGFILRSNIATIAVAAFPGITFDGRVTYAGKG
jgi:hypothetical protein